MDSQKTQDKNFFKPGVYVAKLPIEKVKRNWQVMATYIEQSLPPVGAEYTELRRGSLLKAISDGRLQCWVVVRHTEEQDCKILAFFSTTVLVDPVLQRKSLLLYSIAVDQSDPKVFTEGYKVLKEHAKVSSCTSIAFYMPQGATAEKVEKIKKLVKGMALTMFVLEV